jgi:hypothetical protein
MGWPKKPLIPTKALPLPLDIENFRSKSHGAADKRAPAEEAARRIQAGARHYPEPPFPRQHLPKPGHDYWSLYSASGFDGMSIRNSVPGWRA